MTDQYAVIGNPIGHTKSPLIHGLFAQETQQDMSYTAIEGPVEPQDAFAGAVHAFVAGGGDDHVHTRGGRDRVHGGPGQDTANTGGGIDSCSGVEVTRGCESVSS